MTFDIKPPLFHDLIHLHAKWHPSKIALVDDEQSLTWRALDARSNQVANGLIAHGIGAGDCVAVLMQNCVEYVEIIYGALKAGAVIVPLNLAVDDAGLLRMLDDCAAKAVFATSDQHARLGARIAALTPRIYAVHGDAADAANYAAWRASAPETAPGVPIAEDAPCNIIYSSGTTGQPKGIKHAYRRRIQSMYELALAHRYHFAAKSICPVGLYSNIAWASLFCALIVGGCCVIAAKFEAQAWIESVRSHRITHTFMAPIQFQRVLDAPNFSPEAVSSLEAVISGGSPLFESLKRRVTDNFGCAVIELYGLTEGFMTTLQPEEAEGRLTSVGKPVRGHDYILVDDADQVLAWGATGEICVRSVHWMVEYHNRPDATAEAAFRDPQGLLWLRTGDIGRTDQDGYLYITDRKKDMILSGGQNIYPADIEAVMVGHPWVSEIGVVGAPHPEWGETPIAFVVLRPGAPAGVESEIMAWTNARVGRRQKIAAVELRETLPRNPNGKVLKRELRDAARLLAIV